VNTTYTLKEPWRQSLALMICIGSALYGTWAIFKGTKPSEVGFNVWLAWNQTAQWLDHRHWLFHREGRKFLHKTMGALYQDGKRGLLALSPGLPRLINRGSGLIALAAVLCLFIK
jgi:hypothetical protein